MERKGGQMKLLVYHEVVDAFLFFKDPIQNSEYNMFCEDRISTTVTYAVLILYSTYFSVEILRLSNGEIMSSYGLSCASVVFTLLIPLGLQFVFSRPKDLKTRNWLESALKTLICIETGLLLAVADLYRARLGSVDILLSPESVVWVMTPVLMSMVFHSTDWLGAFYCIFISVACMSVLNWQGYSTTSGSGVIFYAIVSLVTAYEYRRQSVSKFILNQNLVMAIRENDRMADELHATEMRHMIANVAHDLKTPLAGFVHVNEIVSNVVTDCEEKYARQELTPTEMYDYIQSLRSCVKTSQSISTFMLMTINRCIDYTKASQGLKLVPYFGTVNLAESLALPLTVMRDIQSKIQIRLNAISPVVCSHIITDHQWVQENVLCLLSNAIKYSSGGEVSVSITLKPSQEVIAQMRKNNGEYVPHSPAKGASGVELEPATNEMLLFEIEDTGIGLSEESMASLFSPFKQAQRLTGGTGLGLYSLAKRLEALGGCYGVRKRKDGAQGSNFWFAMPYRPDVVSADEATKPPLSMPAQTPAVAVLKVSPPSLVTQVSQSAVDTHVDSPTGIRVLVVDDSMPILKLTSMLLKRNGHTVMQAENGSDAVDLLNTTEQAFDIVLMDLQMPVMDGFEATRRIRAREAECERVRLSSRVPLVNVSKAQPVHQIIVGMSANSDSDTIAEAFEAGMDSFMAKPFALKTFYEVVAKVGRAGGGPVACTPSSLKPNSK